METPFHYVSNNLIFTKYTYLEREPFYLIVSSTVTLSTVQVLRFSVQGISLSLRRKKIGFLKYKIPSHNHSITRRFTLWHRWHLFKLSTHQPDSYIGVNKFCTPWTTSSGRSQDTPSYLEGGSCFSWDPEVRIRGINRIMYKPPFIEVERVRIKGVGTLNLYYHTLLSTLLHTPY